nr:MAG TPA: hypothetical protein [Caudoviricetes sp.]
MLSKKSCENDKICKSCRIVQIWSFSEYFYQTNPI